MTDKPRVLEHKLNVYRSVEITDASVGSPEMRRKALGLSAAMALPAADPVVFERDLWHSLRVWKKEKCKGVWLKLDITAADLVPVAVRAGFEFHRAEPSCITLTAWLDKESENKLPPGPNREYLWTLIYLLLLCASDQALFIGDERLTMNVLAAY